MVIRELSDTGAVRERLALWLIGWAFFAIAAYIAGQATYLLVVGAHPQPSYLGITWTVVTLVAMLALAYGKAVTGNALGNPVLRTEGRVTLVDGYLAGAVLLGLFLNAAAGWWWGPILQPAMSLSSTGSRGAGPRWLKPTTSDQPHAHRLCSMLRRVADDRQ